MGTRIKEFKDAIIEIKKAAKGQPYIDVVAGSLHNQVNQTSVPTLPTCCMAMKQSMHEQDEILIQPNTKTGYGCQFTIRYYLHDLDTRAKINQPNKRGRKKGVLQDKVKELNQNLDAFLAMSNLSYKYKRQGRVYDVEGSNGIWRIHRVTKRLDAGLLKLLRDLNDDVEKGSILMRYSKEALRTWNSYPQNVLNRLNITLLLVNEDGSITEYV